VASGNKARTSVSGIGRILAFTDFSRCAAVATQRAALLADQHRSALRLVHVVEPPLMAAQNWSSSPEAQSRVTSARSEVTAHARSLNRRNGETGVQVLVGSVVEEILGIADQASLLVLGKRGTGAFKSKLLGSTALRLLTRCERPVLVVKQGNADPYRQVLVPIDLRDDAQTTLRATEAFAPTAQVHVLHAYYSPHEGAFLRAGVDKETMQRNRRIVRAKVQSQLNAVVARAEGGTPRFLAHLRRDHPVRMTLASEARLCADLIVMSKRSRSKLEDAILGSTTKRVVEDSRCDVLVIPVLA
jgi:nucleotide-binding universal stress UspA family protein